MKTGSTRRGNLILLIGGYGFGQGSIFLAQTWLISRGQLGLVANFGVSFYVATLAVILVDFGSTAVLARETASVKHLESQRAEPNPVLNPWTDFWAISPLRIAMAGAVIIVGASTVFLTGDEFTRAYAVWAWPALFVWAFNPTGILDGLKLSGTNGVAGALPFVLSGISLALVGDHPPAFAGAALGAAFSTGYALAVAVQVLALQRASLSPRWEPPTGPSFFRAARSGFSALLSTLPGQIYFRLQILLVGIFVGEAGVALFLYAKQIVIGFAQLIGFLRRIEFPDLVGRLNAPHGPILREIMVVQRLGTIAAGAASVAVLVAGLAVWMGTTGSTAEAGRAAALFSPVIATSAILLSLTQALTAQGRYHMTATVMITSAALASSFSLVLAFYRDLAGFAVADVIANLLTIMFASWVLMRSTPSSVEILRP